MQGLQALLTGVAGVLWPIVEDLDSYHLHTPQQASIHLQSQRLNHLSSTSSVYRAQRVELNMSSLMCEAANVHPNVLKGMFQGPQTNVPNSTPRVAGQ